MSNKNIYERFLWFDRKARARKYPNATMLSGQFEVSLKTAQRDIEFMRERLDCPLQYDQSRKGYFYEDETFSLPSIYISSKELSALLITRQMLKGISGDIISSELTPLIDKITTILKKHVIEEVVIDEAVSIQHIEYITPPEAVFKAVLEGCLRRRRLMFSYYSPASDETTCRRVDPYHLFNYMGTWHLVGYCHLRHGLRDFNLARIRDAELLDETFSVRNRFSFKNYFDSAFGLYKGLTKSQVTLRFSPQKAKRIRGQVWHRDQKETLLSDGSLELSFPVADFSEIAMEILKHGSGVEVVRPERLRKLIKEEAEKIAKIY